MRQRSIHRPPRSSFPSSRPTGSRWTSLGVMPLLLGPALVAHSGELKEPPVVRSTSSQLNVNIDVGFRPGTIEGFEAGPIQDMFLYQVNGTGFLPLPATLELGKSRFLNVHLHNDLPCELKELGNTNLHTHGMIVPPTNAKSPKASPMDPHAKGAYGDYSLVTVTPTADCPSEPGGHGGHAGHGAQVDSSPHLPSERGHIHHRIRIPGRHPEGMAWYHPHIHGTSGTQLGGGLAGLLTVGSFWNSAYVHCSDRVNPDPDVDRETERLAVCRTRADQVRETRARQTVDLRTLVLKDFQIEKRPGSSSAWALMHQGFEPTLCGDNPLPTEVDRLSLADFRGLKPSCAATAPSAAPVAPAGASAASGEAGGTPQARPDGPPPERQWLFTVNGQLQPDIMIAAGRHHVWRVANMSANVSHRLQLVIEHGDRLIPVPLQVLAYDGVSVGQTRRTTARALTPPGKPLLRNDLRQEADEPAAAPGTPGAPATEQRSAPRSRLAPLLMMPAARVELLADMDAVCRGFERLSLACPRQEDLRGKLVSFGMRTGTRADKPVKDHPGQSTLEPVGDDWHNKVLANVRFQGSRTPGQDFAINLLPTTLGEYTPEKRQRSRGYSAGDVAALPQKACTLAGTSSTIDRQHYRLIGLNVTPDDEFQMAVATRPDMVLEHGASRLPSEVPAFTKDEYKDFKVVGGNPAVQPSLCVGVPDIFGRRRYQEIWIIRNDSREIHNFHLHQTKFEVLAVRSRSDYLKRTSGFEPGPDSRPLLSLRATGPNHFVDTYPIDVNGLLMIRVTFDRPEQLGTYVFHCHLLEHEDRGMMSLVQVINLR